MNRILGLLCTAIVAGYLVFGWWPFAFRPINRVTWLADQGGLKFEKKGIAFDPQPLPAANDTANRPAEFTIEIWAEAEFEPSDNVYNLLALHDPNRPRDLLLCQWRRELILRAPSQLPATTRPIEAGADNALPSRRPKLLTIRGDAQGTQFFADGVMTHRYTKFRVEPSVLNGELILGNDASGKHPWSGQLRGVAIHDRALSGAEIVQRHAAWTRHQPDRLSNSPGQRALYLFDEGHGNGAHDRSGHQHQLVIPEVFGPLQAEFLTPPWRDTTQLWHYSQDIVINILGFIPFGFCFLLYRGWGDARHGGSKILKVALSGFAISLLIESVQAGLPNRVSSLTDVLTNTIGTLIGVGLALAWSRRWTPRSA